MLDFLLSNWLWFLLIGGMLFMHLGHGGHGGHGGGCGSHGHSGHQPAAHDHGDDRRAAQSGDTARVDPLHHDSVRRR